MRRQQRKGEAESAKGRKAAYKFAVGRHNRLVGIALIFLNRLM